jgi:hypothetical protein
VRLAVRQHRPVGATARGGDESVVPAEEVADPVRVLRHQRCRPLRVGTAVRQRLTGGGRLDGGPAGHHEVVRPRMGARGDRSGVQRDDAVEHAAAVLGCLEVPHAYRSPSTYGKTATLNRGRMKTTASPVRAGTGATTQVAPDSCTAEAVASAAASRSNAAVTGSSSATRRRSSSSTVTNQLVSPGPRAAQWWLPKPSAT